MTHLPKQLRMFLISIYAITFVSLCLFIRNNIIKIEIADYKNIVFFVLLIALTESFTVQFKGISFSTSFAVQLAGFLLFGPLTAIISIIIGFSLRVQKVNGQYDHILNTPIYGTIFNYCVLILPIIYGSYFYILMGGNFFISNVTQIIFQICIFSIVCFFVNTFIISILYSITSNKNVFHSFISNIKLGFLNIFAIAPLGIILAFIFDKYKYIGVIIAIFPIILARYTFSLYIDSKNQYVQTVDAFMHAMEARDKYTEGHSERVAQIATMIARELKYSEIKIEQLNIAALLHDIGKIGISDNILNKPGKLSKEEFDTIKKHPEIGFNIIKDIKNLEYARLITKYHHERYDGEGYPEGKKAEELHFDVFIIQLADSIDAMATDRPYRKALTQEQITDEIKTHTGKQFHPKVVQAYFSAIEKQSKTS